MAKTRPLDVRGRTTVITGAAAGMGAEAVKELLSEIDLAKLNAELEKAMGATKSKQIRKKLAKRLKLVQGFQNSHSRPEWMILDVLPVIPPDLRPLVPLEGGRFVREPGLDEKGSGVAYDAKRQRLWMLHYTQGLVLKQPGAEPQRVDLSDLEFMRDLLLDDSGDVWVAGWNQLVRVGAGGPPWVKRSYRVPQRSRPRK